MRSKMYEGVFNYMNAVLGITVSIVFGSMIGLIIDNLTIINDIWTTIILLILLHGSEIAAYILIKDCILNDLEETK